MSPLATLDAPRSTFRNETPYPFCPGCGHGPILDALDRALVRLGLDPARVVVVSDIGCSGLSDQYFATSAFHGLHGRSLTYAAGIKLARPDLEVVVVMGDGGTGIGGAHLLSAARRNVGMTVLVCNNLNYGMTGGQHSATTPEGSLTSTTPDGNLERALDVCATVAVNGAAYVWRGTSFDADLTDRIVEAVETPGFALLDVWELCTAHFVPRNRASKRTLTDLMDRYELPTGLIQYRAVPEYAAAYREAHAADRDRPSTGAAQITPAHRSAVDRRLGVVLAGKAGARVRSAGRTLAEAAVRSGLWVAQRDDYPVTVKTGHSLSYLALGPDPIGYAGTANPEAVLVLAEEGRRKVAGLLARLPATSTVLALPALADSLETGATVRVLDPTAVGAKLVRSHESLIGIAALARYLDLVPLAALEETVRGGEPERVEADLQAVRAGYALGA